MKHVESGDEALCFGWIDGVRHSVDELRYVTRFTPRRPDSNWSAVNIERVRVLTEEGRMTPAGRQAFAMRKESKSRIYTYEQPEKPAFTEAEIALFRQNTTAWTYFDAQAQSYQSNGAKWLASAKLPATRARRLQALIDASEQNRKLW